MKQVLFNLLLAFFISGGVANAATNTLHDKPLKTAPAGTDETYVWDTVTSTLKKTTFAPFLVGDCTGFPCLDGTSDGGNYIKLWAGTGSYWTALQGGSPAANRSWRLPIAAPPAAGTTYIMNMDEYGQMGFVDPATLGGGATTINDLTDVDTTGKATGKILKFDASGNLVVGDDSTGSGSVPSGTVNGQLLIWATDQWVASSVPTWNQNTTGTAAGITGYSIVTTVGATGADTNIPTEQAVREAFSVLPNLAFDSATLTTTTVGDTDTISVKANTFQGYDADWAGITPNGASLVSAANYAAMRTLLDLEAGTDFNTYDADLTTWAGVTPGTGVATALAVNADTVGGIPTIIAKGAYTVDTAGIAANTCASAVAVTATGVATTDTIIATPNAILSTVAGFGVTTAGSVRVDVYPTSGNVNFQFCNPTGTAIDPDSVTFNWKVLR